ncbi:MAG: calcium-translocating P-type ATPase, PMCA-type [Clostridia bacterium]|nr:calcium-translocating P-type ATPase, PMCA-type [Clostridia bacterium]
MAIYNQNFSTLYKQFSSGEKGLSTSQASKNKQTFGQNILASKKPPSLISRFFAQFKNLMVLVLLFSALISCIISIATKTYSDIFEGVLIFVIVVVNALIGMLQEKRAFDAISLLNNKTKPLSKIYRDGKLVKLQTEEIVVGDIISLKAGDYIPADIRLIETNNFKCDESPLTGESVAVLKNSNSFLKEQTPLAEQETMCFAGTNATYGSAKGIVVSVGKNTEMGKITKLITNTIKEKSPLEKNIDKIGKIITFSVLIITFIVFITELIFSKNISFMDAFLISIALAVAAIPESLPAVITIVMALGVERLAKKQAIVKTLSAVETLGCCNVICTDKTGTLTQNKMSVNHIFLNQKLSTDFSINSQESKEFFRAISLCNNAQIDKNNNIVGDATETALLSLCLKSQSSIQELTKGFVRTLEIPFDSSRKTMTTVYKTPIGSYVYTKGAYDYLINNCSHLLFNGEKIPLNESKKQEIERAVCTLGSNAERVIALAVKNLDNFSQKDIETNLTFIGLVGIVDPPKKEAKKAIQECHNAGLKPIMITGDHPETAFAIAKELKIAKNKKEIIAGTQIDKLSISELSKTINDFSVFARVTPEHKVKIVKAFKKAGKIVAMTGDGVNDAPSLSSADIGVCMGISGTDVTKSVADIVITDDNYETIVTSVKQGRTIYSNIQKIIQFLISTNAVEVLGIFISTIILRDSVFLLPSQILFINLVTDSFPAFALGLEKPEKGIMNSPPRDPKSNLFSGRVGTGILYQSVVQTLLVLVVFVFGVNKYGNQVASTMVFLIICLMQIIHAINCKSLESIFTINIFNNLSFNLSFIGLFGLIMLVAFVPFLQTAFGIVPLNLSQWLVVALASISIIPLVEICKLFVNKSYKKNFLKQKNSV